MTLNSASVKVTAPQQHNHQLWRGTLQSRKMQSEYLNMSRSGFRKDCKCCHESFYGEKTVTLRSCYNEAGHKINSGSKATMQVN